MASDKYTSIFKLDDLTAIHVSGADATKFLHAQFTNDLASLPLNNWQYTGYCTPKGRLLAFITIAKTGENDYLLIIPGDISEAFTRRISMFVMRDDVTITAIGDQASLTGIIGSVSDLRNAGIAAGDNDHALATADGTFTLTIDTTTGRYLFIGNREKLEALTYVEADRNEWVRHDIRAGIPTVVSATQEAFVPQMVNLDLIGAVNFKKGCYPGQEVVARVHYLGKIKQRMYLATSTKSDPAQAGDKIYLAGEEDKAAGTVVQSASEDSGQLVQIVLQTAAVDQASDIRLHAADGEKLVIGDQPYAVEDGD